MTLEPPDRMAAARRRRASGTVDVFSGARLGIARRLARLPRTELAQRVGVSPTAITQLEREQIKPTTTVAAGLALALGVPVEFFANGLMPAIIPGSSAHFRSLRATPALTRDQALAFAEVGLEVVTALEDFVDLPTVNLPTLDAVLRSSPEGIAEAASQARQALDVADGPVPNVVRLLESRGVLVLRLPDDLVDPRVDAFSTSLPRRPIVLLSPLKDDKARSRFDSAHELGHLLMHPDAEPGSKLIEHEAHSFAAAFLMPADQIIDDLPRRLDWNALNQAKRRWGVSLKALVYRAHHLNLFSDSTYKRANIYLSRLGNPEPTPLGPPESPSMLGTAISLLVEHGVTIDDLAAHAAIPADVITRITAAATDRRPQVSFD